MQHTYQRDALQPPCCCCLLLLCAAPLPLCCSAAQVQLVWLCNHWVRLHCCTLPVLLLKLLLWLGLGWRAQTFFVSWVSMACIPWLGYLGLGRSWKYLEYSINSANCPVSPIVHLFPLSSEKAMSLLFTCPQLTEESSLAAAARTCLHTAHIM